MLLKDAIYDYDYQLNVEEDFIVCKKNNFNVSHYLHGKCHLFALALHEATGLKIGLFVDEERFEGVAGLEHAFCYIDDEYIVDAQGIRSKDEAFNQYCSETWEFSEYQDDGTIIKDWMETNRLDPYENEFEKNSIKLYVEEFINLNLHIYIPD